MMDLTESIEPRSDQVNADDLIAGPITYTIREVIAGKAESPFDFLLVETDRAYRPSKTMRRVIVNAWGADAAAYAGRRLTLYREPTIKFGGATVGGIRISHLSDIDKRLEVMLQTTRGKREKFVVDPMPELTVDDRIASLRAEFRTADETRKAAILDEVKALQGKDRKPEPKPKPAAIEPHKPVMSDDGEWCTVDGCGLAVSDEVHKP